MNQQKKRKSTEEFKQEAVKLVPEQGYGISEAVRNLGLSRSMLGSAAPRVKWGESLVSGRVG